MSTATTVMPTKEIARRLKRYCDEGDFEGAHRELYARDAVSIEPQAGHGFEKETRGLDNIIQKGKQWMSMVKEMHGFECSEPLVVGNSFTVSQRIDVTMKEGGRMDMLELCVYRVKDGKIISEEFYM